MENDKKEEELKKLEKRTLPKIFAHQVTVKDLDERPELSAQDLKEGDIRAFREISADDIEEFDLAPELINTWAINSHLEDNQLSDHHDFRIEIGAGKNGLDVEVNIISRKDEQPLPFMMIGALQTALEELIFQFKGRAKNREQFSHMGQPADLVNYTLTEFDIQTMGERNPGHKAGDVIQLPKALVDSMNMTNEIGEIDTNSEASPSECGEGCDCNKE